MDNKLRLKQLISDAINDGYMEFGDANEMFSFIIDSYMDDRDALDTIQQFFPGIGEVVESSLDWDEYYARQAQEAASNRIRSGSESQISNDYDLDKLYDVMEDFGWEEFDNPEEKIEAMEDNGYAVADPCTLRAACELIYSYTPDLEEALRQIDYDYGNSIGVFPLCIYDWKEQQDIYENWYKETYG